MKDLKLKICGMKHSDNILEVALLEPDYLGFILYKNSPRNFSGEIPTINSAIKKTGVFVDAEIDFVLEMIEKYHFSAVQLHGKESAEYCTKLKLAVSNESVEIIKVFSVKESFNFEELQPYEGIVDLFLFDTKGKSKGGNGITFDWELLKEYSSPTPFFLSGGIGLEELEKIEELYNHFENQQKSHLLYGVDVNSKFEIEAGLKNVKSLRIFKDNLGLKASK